MEISRIARIGEEGGNDEEGWNIKRKSKDKTVNNRGRLFIDLVGETEGYILNKTTRDDKEKDFTFVSAKGCSVSDYVMIMENCDNMVKHFRIMERVDSDHMLLVVELEEEGEEERKEEENERNGRAEEKGKRICWNQKALELYWERTNSIE